MKSLHSTRYRRFLQLLVEARQASGLSQQAVADKLGRPQSFLSKCESGERRVDLVEFLALAEIIGIDAPAFVDQLVVETGAAKRSLKRRLPAKR